MCHIAGAFNLAGHIMTNPLPSSVLAIIAVVLLSAALAVGLGIMESQDPNASDPTAPHSSR